MYFRHAPLASPKLLDFGLARETSDAAATVRYLSPEVLSGRPAADEADDVWSLCVMLHEIVSGEHPFAENGVDEVTDRIRRQRLGRAARAPAGPDASSALIAFTVSMLAAPRSARPATARAFADALHGVRRRQVGPLLRLLGLRPFAFSLTDVWI